MLSLTLYVIAVGLVGFAVGCLVAISQTPVVSAVMPLLFGLIAGASGVFVANETLDNTDSQRRIRFIAACIISFVCLNLFGLGLFLWLLRPKLEPELLNINNFASLDAQGQKSVAELRVRSKLLGMSVEEQKEFLEKATVPPNNELTLAVLDGVQRYLTSVSMSATDSAIAKLSTEKQRNAITAQVLYIRALVKSIEQLKSIFSENTMSQSRSYNLATAAAIMSSASKQIKSAIGDESNITFLYTSNKNTSSEDSVDNESVVNDPNISAELLASILLLDGGLDAANEILTNVNDQRNVASQDILSDDLVRAFNDLPASSKSAVSRFTITPVKGPPRRATP